MTRKKQRLSVKEKKNNPSGCITLQGFNSYSSHVLREYQIHSKYNEKQTKKEREELNNNERVEKRKIMFVEIYKYSDRYHVNNFNCFLCCWW
jgi:predicted AAA+ superfamily ATPase